MLDVGFFNQKEIEAPTLLDAVVVRDMQQRRQLCLSDGLTGSVTNKFKFVAIIREAATRDDAEADTLPAQNNQSATVDVRRMEHSRPIGVFDCVAADLTE